MLGTSRWILCTAGAAVAITVLSACGGGSSGGSSAGNAAVSPAGGTVDQKLAAMVPSSIKSDGTITVGIDTTYPPNDFLAADGKTAVGMDVDLFNAVAAKLGLKTKYVTAPFPTLIQAVDSGKYEIGVSSFTINPDREKQTLMVSYLNAGTQWATQKGNPSGIQPDNACGHKVAVQKGTVQVDDLTARSKKCKDAGKPSITIDQYDAQNAATAAVISKKDDAMLADSPVCAYAVLKTNGQLELLGSIYDSAPYGYVIPKSEMAFAKAVQGGIKAIIADGSYHQIIAKWGSGSAGISSPQINPRVP